MLLTSLKTAVLGLLVMTGFPILSHQAFADKPGAKEQPLPPLTMEQFGKLHKMIKPQPGELRFQEIPWLISVSDARKKAAIEGKPILVWSAAGGAPLGVC